MKKLTLSLIVAGGLSLSSVAFAQIPVTDGASIAQQVAAQVETIAKWKMQYDQMMSQIEQAKQQYESLTGSRGLGNIMNNPALRDYLPGDWQAVSKSADAMRRLGLFASLAAQDVFNVAVVQGALNAGWAGQAPYDAILIEGAIEEIPAAITDQLNEGGRIIALFREGHLGVVKFGRKIDGRINWRFAFHADAPVLPGFAQLRGFIL